MNTIYIYIGTELISSNPHSGIHLPENVQKGDFVVIKPHQKGYSHKYKKEYIKLNHGTYKVVEIVYQTIDMGHTNKHIFLEEITKENMYATFVQSNYS